MLAVAQCGAHSPGLRAETPSQAGFNKTTAATGGHRERGGALCLPDTQGQGSMLLFTPLSSVSWYTCWVDVATPPV